MVFKAYGDGLNKEFKDASAISGNIYEYYVLSATVERDDKFVVSNSIKVLSQ